MVSDENTSYKSLRYNYLHHTVKHSQGEYVRGYVHSNGIENYWSLLKRGIIGIYHQVSAKHLDRYCNEFSYRFNTRKTSDTDRFIGVLARSEGRLKYADLIAEK